MRAVAFDAMGVLYRGGDDLVEGLIPFALARGSSLPSAEVAPVYRRAMMGSLAAAALWSELGVSGDSAELEEHYLARYELVPGIVELLDELRDRGVVLGCISNDVAEWSRARRVRHGLDRRIMHWTVSGEARVRKPDERIYRAFLESTGLAPDAVVLVDDRPVNLAAAAALGFSGGLIVSLSFVVGARGGCGCCQIIGAE